MQDEKNLIEEKPSAMVKVATFVVDRRNLFFLLFGIAMIFCLIATRWVKVENALSAYLPESSETARGLDRMEEEFITYGSARVMVMNISYEEAAEIADEIEARDDVYMRFKEIGFTYVTLDIKGYRTGSMNETLSEDEKK